MKIIKQNQVKRKQTEIKHDKNKLNMLSFHLLKLTDFYLIN